MSLTPNQIAERSNTIGASECLDCQKDPLGLYEAKVLGISKYSGDEPFLRLGNLFEPALLRWWARQNGCKVIPAGRWADGVFEPLSFRHPSIPWMAFTPDGIVVDEDCPLDCVPDLATLWDLIASGVVRGMVEIKTNARVAEFGMSDDDKWGADGTDEMPLRIYCQCVWMLGMSGLPEMPVIRLRFIDEAVRKALIAIDAWTPLDASIDGVLVALLESGAATVHQYRVEANPGVFRWLKAGAAEFVGRYLTLPAMIPPPSTLEQVQALVDREYPEIQSDAIVTANDCANWLAEEWMLCKVAEAKIAVRQKMIQALIQREAGGSSSLKTLAGVIKVSNVAGRRSVNTAAALTSFADVIQSKGIVIPDAVLNEAKVIALECATTQKEGSIRVTAPRKWTSGIKDAALRDLAREFGVEVVPSIGGDEEE